MSLEADHNDALNPIHLAGLSKTLSTHYDFKYKVVKSYEEICEEALKTEGAVNLVIYGHGNREGIHISGDNNLENWIHIYKQNQSYKDFSCLKNIESIKRIILFSCRTGSSNGENVDDNIASLIVSETGKEVIAPTELISPRNIEITSVNPIDFMHPSKYDQKENVFKKFKPKSVDDKK